MPQFPERAAKCHSAASYLSLRMLGFQCRCLHGCLKKWDGGCFGSSDKTCLSPTPLAWQSLLYVKSQRQRKREREREFLPIGMDFAVFLNSCLFVKSFWFLCCLGKKMENDTAMPRLWCGLWVCCSEPKVDIPKTLLRKDPRFKPLHQMLIDYTAKAMPKADSMSTYDAVNHCSTWITQLIIQWVTHLIGLIIPESEII